MVLILKFDKELKEERIFAGGKELASKLAKDTDKNGNRVYTWPDFIEQYVATIKNPVLVTDHFRIGKLKPSTLRETVRALFEAPVRKTEYNGTSLRFEQGRYNGVWGPSIDTLLFCRGLENEVLKDVKSAIELGSGSGFISKYLLNNLPNLKNTTLIDLNKKAKECTEDNIRDKRAEFVIGDGIEYMEEKGKKYDLIVCNPPYIPRPKSIDDNAYEGVSLLAYLIKNSHKYLKDSGIFITNISSMCENIIYDIISKEKINAKKIDSMKVPLKVFNVLNNEVWMDYLVKCKGLKKVRFNKKGYDYWQTINITEVRR